MARELWEWEGARAVPRLLSGLLLVVVVGTVGWIGGLVLAAYVIGNLEKLSLVVMGVAIGVAVEVGAGWAWHKRWWRRPLESRLERYHRLREDERTENFAIRGADFDRAASALRRAKLNPWSRGEHRRRPAGTGAV